MEAFEDEARFELGFLAGTDRETAEAMMTLGVLDPDAPSSEAFEDGLATARGCWAPGG